jgi:hypothetical protein
MNRIRSTFIFPLVLICAHGQPARADAPRIPSGSAPAVIEHLPPGDPLGYRAAVIPTPPGGAAPGRLFDPPVSGQGIVTAPPLLAAWRGAPEGTTVPGLDGPGGWYRAPGGGGNGGGHGTPDTDGDGRGASCERGNASFCPQPPGPDPRPQPGVPGPVPLLGAAAAWGWARRIRRRIR